MKGKRMSQLVSIVVPVFNERSNLPTLIEQLDSTLRAKKLAYEIILIDDNSTDDSYTYLSRLKKKHIAVFKKKGPQGKAFSLKQGFEKAAGNVIAMIDADLQYPPSALPAMIDGLKTADIVIANRKNYKDTSVRKFFSRTFRYLFGNVLFGLPYDIQSGLKVFKSHVFKSINFVPSSSWTFDLEFLYRASHAGHVISMFDITFSRRRDGSSKVKFLKTIVEIGSNALKVRLIHLKPQLILPSKIRMQGAGMSFKKTKYITHTLLSYNRSAAQTFVLWQKVLICLSILVLAASAGAAPLRTLQVIIVLLSGVYFLDVLFNLYLIVKSLHFPQEITSTNKELEALTDSKLPTYSILCPLYREAHVLPQFIKAIEKIEWPKEKLDVMLLLEEDDVETIQQVRKMRLPSYMRYVVVPDSLPKTKPKACNYGLSLAKGEYLVIYDAEDMPDPLQLKKAFLGFKKATKDIICLQAKLNYYNPNQNLLTRFFTAEYSLWFDVTLTGLQSIETTIPLGGTSNHFRTNDLLRVYGWDPFNVTEDADLGIRLFKAGYRTAIIDSTTLEEANSKVKNWVRQRSRWIKGYMQTYLVHMRESLSFLKTSGKHAVFFQLTVGGKLAFILINPLLWITTISYFVFNKEIGLIIESVYLTPAFYMGIISLALGNFLHMYYYMLGCAKRNQWSLMKYIFLVPFYWILLSVAGYIALYQLIVKPHYWEKTIHGFHLLKPAKRTPAFQPQSATGSFRSAFLHLPTLPGFIRIRSLQIRFAQSIMTNITDFLSLFTGPKMAVPYAEKGLNVLMLNWRDTKHSWAGGAEMYVHELAKRFVDTGNHVTVFCGNDAQSKKDEVIDNVQIIRRGGLYTVYFWAFLYYILHLRGKYDVIVDSENGLPFFTPLYIRKPVFLLIHHIHQEVFRRHLPMPFAQLAMFLETKVMPLVYKNKTVITVSESSKKEIARIGLAQLRNIEVINPGIHTDQFIRTAKTKYPSYMYLGRLKPYKNVDLAILAFSQVVKEVPQAQFFIVGEGESRSKLLRLVQKLKLQDNVKFFGRVSEKMKVSLLAKSWIVVQPSMVEGWGITVLEANAAGTPVIASRVKGLQDSVVHRRTGLLFKAGSINELTQAMRILILQPEMLATFSEEAYFWSRNFSWEKSADMFYASIQKTLTPVYQPRLSKVIFAGVDHYEK